MTDWRLTLIAGILAIAAAVPLHAQEATTGDPEKPEDPANQPPRYEETIEVRGELPAAPAAALTPNRLPASLMETPASVSIVPRALFESQRAFTLGDALRNAAGVNVGTGFGTFDYFVIRGFDSLNTGLVLTDSVAEPESTFYPLYNVRQVEVLKGPGAFLYGANPLSGAVQLVRKQPQPRPFADLSFGYGSFQSAEGRVDANAANADGSLAARFNGLYRDSNAYRDDKENRIAAVNPTVAWRLDGATRLALSFEYVRAEFEPDSGIPVLGQDVPDVPRTRSYQSPFDVSEQDIYRIRFDTECRLNERLTLRNKLYYTDLDWSSDGTLINGVLPLRAGETLVFRTMTMLDDRQKALGDQAEAVVSFATGGATHSLLTGVELTRLTDDFTLDIAGLPPIGLETPFETATPPVPFPGFGQRGDTRSFVVAPYMVDRVTLSKSVQVFAGGRFDVLDYEDEVTATSRKPRQFSPMAGVVYWPQPSLSVYASAGSAFAPPSTLVIGPREPERSRQLELGAKRTLAGGRAFASLALYHLERDDIAIPDESGVARQTGDQRSRGLELELAGDLGRGVYVSAAYALNDATLTRFSERVQLGANPPFFQFFDRSGNDPAFAPTHLANLWLMKRLPAGFEVGAGARYVGRQFIAEDNAFSLDGYLLVDAAVGYRLRGMTLRLNLKNLTDRDYFTRGFGSASVIPGDPLAVYAQVELGVGGR